jgi:cation transport regulator ChaB
MPRSRRYGRLDELPGTLRRSCQEAQESFTKALSSAILLYGDGDQARRTAYTVLKEKFEKRGDHWVPKRQPAD